MDVMGMEIMTKVRLSERDLRVLLATQFDSTTSVAALSKALKYPSHQVRYSLNRLIDEEILKPRVVVDSSCFGQTEFSLALSVLHGSTESRDTLHRLFTTHRQVADVLLLDGHFDYYLTVVARSVQEVLLLLREAAEIPDIKIINKNISIRIRCYFYRSQYLIDGADLTDVLEYGSRGAVSVDPTDMKILDALRSRPSASLREVARSLKMPHTTLLNRISSLKESGVLVAFPYGFHAQKLNIHVFRLFVYVSSLSSQELEQLRAFCRSEPQIVMLIETAGVWDFEIRIEVYNAEDSRDVKQRLYQLLGSNVNRIELLPMFRYLKGLFGEGYKAISTAPK